MVNWRSLSQKKKKKGGSLLSFPVMGPSMRNWARAQADTLLDRFPDLYSPVVESIKFK